MAKSEEWRRGFQTGGLIIGLILLVPSIFSLWAWHHARKAMWSQAQAVEQQQATINQLEVSLKQCRETSKRNYELSEFNLQTAKMAVEAAEKLRALVAQYQAQIQRGQAPAGLAEFLLKLLVQ